MAIDSTGLAVLAEVADAYEPVAKREAMAGAMRALAHAIERAFRDLAEINVGELSSKDVPTAADQLEAVVQATESATNAILAAAEKIEKVQTEVAAPQAAKLGAIVGEIYEACSFQDITGQRIAKVLRALRTIEERLAKMAATLDRAGTGPVAPTADKRTGDEALLNGPQLASQAMSQEEIDRLLADL
jgi:chemotaxis protein CheZ